MKILITIIALGLASQSLFAQMYMTKNGHIKFFSSTPMEDIEANNNQVNCALDSENGNFVFKVLIKSFEFEKALMQEHFNENYMESGRIPTSTFVGNVVNIQDVDFKKDGSYDVEIKGDLSIHGVTKSVLHSGIFEVKGDQINGRSTFKVKIADYDIKMASTVADNVADEIEVTVDVKLIMKK